MIDFKVALSSTLIEGGKPDQAIALLEKAIIDYPEQFTGDIALAKFSARALSMQQACRLWKPPTIAGGKNRCRCLKQYTASLANNGNTQTLSSIISEYRELWQEELNYGHGITMGFFGAMAGLPEASEILEETINAHPDKFDADLELAKIYSNTDPSRAEEVLERAYLRNNKQNINVLKAYTQFQFSQEPAQRSRDSC